MNKNILGIFLSLSLLPLISFASTLYTSPVVENTTYIITSNTHELTQDWIQYKKIDEQIDAISKQNEENNLNINTQFTNKETQAEFSTTQIDATFHNMRSVIESYSPQTPEFEKLKQIKIKLINTFHKLFTEQAMNKSKNLINTNEPSETMVQMAYLLDELDEYEEAIKAKIDVKP